MFRNKTTYIINHYNSWLIIRRPYYEHLWTIMTHKIPDMRANLSNRIFLMALSAPPCATYPKGRISDRVAA